ncbi:ATP-binding protein [Streptomyces monomycini]|nr:ATP-binding protein [Streptomyces monomycini]
MRSARCFSCPDASTAPASSCAAVIQSARPSRAPQATRNAATSAPLKENTQDQGTSVATLGAFFAPAPQRRFPGTAGSVGRARAYARQVVEQSVPGIAEGQVALVEFLVSELVTDACRHGAEPGGSVAVTMCAFTGGVQIQVHAAPRRRPRHKPRKPARQRGRGLLIVGALADSWGVADRPLGKIGWAEPAW